MQAVVNAFIARGTNAIYINVLGMVYRGLNRREEGKNRQGDIGKQGLKARDLIAGNSEGGPTSPVF